MRPAPLFVSLAVVLNLAAGCAEAPPPVPVAPAQEAPAADPFPVLASPAEQARMQKYADDLYDRRYVRSSLHVVGGDFDCVDFDKQPGCKNGGCPASPPQPPQPPPPPPTPGGRAPAPAAAAFSVGPVCAEGTIPVRRPDVHVMARFHTLEEYLRGGKVAPPH